MKAGSLSEQIEALVREHLAQVRTEATAALEQAFATSTPPTKAKGSSRKRAQGKRRDPAQVAELAERLHERIVAEPGESMTLHAQHLGANVRELHRPMSLLRQAGRLRTTGVRNRTRYYPTPGS